VSDFWYRDAQPIPLYEDWLGNLWTHDGVCLNPVQGCEEPAYMHDLDMLELRAEIVMGFFEKLFR